MTQQQLDEILFHLRTQAEVIARVQLQVAQLEETVQRLSQKESSPAQLPEATLTGHDADVVARGVDALKEWTGKDSVSCVYDSNVDAFTHDGLFEKIVNKPNIALVGFTADGDVFGAFHGPAATRFGRNVYDPSMFLFSFESHGRCPTPQRFFPQRCFQNVACVKYVRNCGCGFVEFLSGPSRVWLGNGDMRTASTNAGFGFDGLSHTTLTGANHVDDDEFFLCVRVMAFQLE